MSKYVEAWLDRMFLIIIPSLVTPVELFFAGGSMIMLLLDDYKQALVMAY